MARPLRADGRSQPFSVWLSPAERQRVAKAAAVNRQNLSEFARDALMTAADDCLEDVLERFPTRSTAH